MASAASDKGSLLVPQTSALVISNADIPVVFDLVVMAMVVSGTFVGTEQHDAISDYTYPIEFLCCVQIVVAFSKHGVTSGAFKCCPLANTGPVGGG